VSYEIREMSFGEILDMGFTLLRNHFGVLVGIAAVLYLPVGLLWAWSLPARGAVPDVEQLIAIGIVSVMITAIAYPIVLAAVTHAVGESYLGRRATIGHALRLGLSILLPLLGTAILAGLARVVGLLLIVVPGIYLWLAFFLLPQVMVLERSFGFAAMSRSHELMKGHKLRAFGLFTVTTLITMVASNAFSLVGLVLPGLGALLGALAEAVGVAFASAVSVVFYFDIRCRKEAFDLEHLARLVEDEAAPTLPAPIG